MANAKLLKSFDNNLRKKRCLIIKTAPQKILRALYTLTQKFIIIYIENFL